MKNSTMRMRTAALLAIGLSATYVAAQGSLTPPGAPGATMKTLEQVEPRIDLATLAGAASFQHVIFAPGSYYLSGNLNVTNSGGILINASNVMLDLNGFQISSGGTAAEGIRINGVRQHITVRNGTITGFDYGVRHFSSPKGTRFENLAVSGCATYGIYAGLNSLIEDCRFSDNTGIGLYADAGSTIRHCMATENQSEGILTASGCLVSECTAQGNLGTGISVADGSTVSSCSSSGNQGIGILAASDCRVSDCTLTGNATGFQLSGTGAYVADNIVRGNTNNYNFSVGNQLNLLLCEVPETIDWPCSVKLAGSLTGTGVSGVNGITIRSGNVTIDMAGHSLSGGGGLSYGIGTESYEYYTNIVVRSGTIQGWGLQGIALSGKHHQVAKLTLSGNGGGLWLGDDALVRQVSALDNSGSGIYVGNTSRVLDSVSVDNTYYSEIYGIRAGDNSVVSGCVAENNLSTGSRSLGIQAGIGSTIINCTAQGNESQQSSVDSFGIYGMSGSTIQGCTASGNIGRGDGYGITGGGVGSIIRDCVAKNNTTTGNGYGIYGGDGATIDHCTSAGNLAQGSFGFAIYGGKGASIVNCSATDNNADVYSVGAGIYGDKGALISGCTVSRNEGGGFAAALAAIYGGLNSTILQCTVSNNEGQGIRVSNRSVVKGNNVSGCGSFSDFGGSAAAILVVTSGNRIEGNHITTSNRGVDVNGTGNLIVRNTANGNTTNYDIVAGNKVGTIQTSPVGAGAWDNFSF